MRQQRAAAQASAPHPDPSPMKEWGEEYTETADGHDDDGRVRAPGRQGNRMGAPQRCRDAEGLIPGCESLEKLSDTDFKAVVKVKIGPVSARFNGKVHLTDIQRPTAIASLAKAKAA